MQPRFRSLWERYCRGVQAIVYVVDAADHEAVKVGRQTDPDDSANITAAKQRNVDEQTCWLGGIQLQPLQHTNQC